MSAFGYGSSYSFKNGDFTPGFTQGMGQDPRQIVSKSGMDTGMSQQKGAMATGPASSPVLSGGGIAADPFGLNIKPSTPEKDPGGFNMNTPTQQPFYNLAYNFGNFEDNQYASGNLAGQYQQAFNQLSYDRSLPADPLAQGINNQFQSDLEKRYQQWLNQMLQGGSFGLTGGGMSYGQRQGGF